MSYASKVKEELAGKISGARHCNIAELSAIISLCGQLVPANDDHYLLEIHTENVTSARKYFTLLKKTFNISISISARQNAALKKNRVHTLTIENREDVDKVLGACGLMGTDLSLSDPLVIRRDCCKRAYIRGAFLASGSISDPVRTYHFEIVCANEEKARQIQTVMDTYDIGAKVIMRRNHAVVYVKDGSKVIDLLNIMGAHQALMGMENIRIVKEMRNQVNRKLNCEMANIGKTVAASMKQVEDIQLIMQHPAFEQLPRPLKEIAQLRVENQEASLAELGKMLDKPVGRSGVNHRLKKLSSIADEIRMQGSAEMRGKSEKEGN